MENPGDDNHPESHPLVPLRIIHIMTRFNPFIPRFNLPIETLVTLPNSVLIPSIPSPQAILNNLL